MYLGDKFDYLAFDLDGTLINTEEGIVEGVQLVLNQYGFGQQDITSLRRFIGPPLDHSFKEFYGFSDEDSKEAVARFREYYNKTGQNKCAPYDGIENALSELKSLGYKLLVATSKPITPAVAILERFGLAGYFDRIEGTPVGKLDVTKSDVIEAALTAVGNPDRSRVLMIGDRMFDIIGAKQTGLASMGVLYGFGSREEFSEHGADYIAETVEDIVKCFK